MERCPYVYVTSEGKQSQCIHDENDAHRHTLSNYPWQQYGNPTRWKLPQDFRGTALTPVIVPSDRGLIMYTMLHVHGQAGTCLKNRFTSTADCPVVKNHESCPEKTDSEKQSEYVAVDHRVVIAINDLGTVREFNRSLTSLNDAPEVMESMIKRHSLKGVHILNVRVEARTVTTTAWEAMG